jgi:2-polyprenyl-3-methyl-5-hydroxy-6-metoxy-1,4-benzoquinol methylase
MAKLGYVSDRKKMARIILPISRYLRGVNAERYIDPRKRLLDIGCGDGFFLLRSKCRERYALEQRTGDEAVNSLSYPDQYFDFVTMLAVLDHIKEPIRLFSEIHGLLKPRGWLLIAISGKQAEFIIRLCAKNIGEEHKAYYNLTMIKSLAAGLIIVVRQPAFRFGLN